MFRAGEPVLRTDGSKARSVSRSSVRRPARALPPDHARGDGARGWDELDILIVTGDAYVDHPAFGADPHRALPRGARLQRRHRSRSRDWDSPDDIAAHGRAAALRRRHRRQPRLDAQQAHGAEEDRAREDQYSPGRRARTAAEPRDASSTRTSAARRSRACPIVLGGIEASLRRIAHYDYWSDSGAPLDPPRREGRSARLRHGRAPGVGDRASASQRGETRRRSSATCAARRTCRRTGASGSRSRPTRASYVADGKIVVLPVATRRSSRTRRAFARDVARVPVRDQPAQRAPAPAAARRRGRLLQLARAAARRGGDGRALRSPVRPRARTRATREPIPAFETVKHSIVTMRGCFGGCTFCSHHRARGARHPEPLARRASCARCARSRAWSDFSRRPSPTSVGRPPTCTR